ncbi:MAG TPA: VanW family protein [Clostridia bacterium]|nr:VanW family protein [Clostridia bacterium]
MNASPSIDKNPAKRIRIIIIIFVIAIFLCINLYIWLFDSSKIFSNIFINNIDVSQLTLSEARQKVSEELEKQLDEFIIQLVYNDNAWNLTRKDIDLYYLLDEGIEEAYNVGRGKGYFHKIKTILNLRKSFRAIKLMPNYDLSGVEDKIGEISKTINRAPVDAKIERKNGNFIITKEVPGMAIDGDTLRHNILVAINNFNNMSIDIEAGDTEPGITSRDLSSIKDLIGESVTIFNSQDMGRTENIKIAVNSINNTVLMPGEEFSFNNSTGPRSAEAGYKEASVIVSGEFTVGIGGGVCQVSTTLYRAALKSDMEITSRQNHGLPVSYVPMGQDATVAYGYIDLKFRNNKEYPVYIEGFVRDEEIYIRLYGKKTDNTYVDLESEVLEVIEPKMQVKKDENMYISEKKVSKSGKRGYRAVTHKVYLQGGQEVKRELVTRDYYPPRDGLIIEGTKQE